MLSSCPAHHETPLTDSSVLADKLGSGEVWLKSETGRMGLGSFKALGGAFAVAQMVSDASGGAEFNSDKAREAAEKMTFITASAGNHGLSVAAGARVFGAHASIVLAAAVPEEFANRIRATGAEVIRVAGSYEDSVTHAIEQAEERGWIHLADGSWEGYTDAPALIMEGYTVLAEELRAKFAQSGEWPTHVFLQAGVGGLAAAVCAHIRAFWPEQPVITVVEPDAAPCLLRSVEAGQLTRVTGPVSDMGRLDCKVASLIAFETLRAHADYFCTISEADAQWATTEFSEAGIATTPSGGAALAGVRNHGSAVGVDANSRCLLIISEGPEEA